MDHVDRTSVLAEPPSRVGHGQMQGDRVLLRGLELLGARQLERGSPEAPRDPRQRQCPEPAGERTAAGPGADREPGLRVSSQPGLERPVKRRAAPCLDRAVDWHRGRGGRVEQRVPGRSVEPGDRRHAARGHRLHRLVNVRDAVAVLGVPVAWLPGPWQRGVGHARGGLHQLLLSLGSGQRRGDQVLCRRCAAP